MLAIHFPRLVLDLYKVLGYRPLTRFPGAKSSPIQSSLKPHPAGMYEISEKQA